MICAMSGGHTTFAYDNGYANTEDGLMTEEVRGDTGGLAFTVRPRLQYSRTHEYGYSRTTPVGWEGPDDWCSPHRRLSLASPVYSYHSHRGKITRPYVHMYIRTMD